MQTKVGLLLSLEVSNPQTVRAALAHSLGEWVMGHSFSVAQTTQKFQYLEIKLGVTEAHKKAPSSRKWVEYFLWVIVSGTRLIN